LPRFPFCGGPWQRAGARSSGIRYFVKRLRDGDRETGQQFRGIEEIAGLQKAVGAGGFVYVDVAPIRVHDPYGVAARREILFHLSHELAHAVGRREDLDRKIGCILHAATQTGWRA
jgi:hypothetical protein